MEKNKVAIGKRIHNLRVSHRMSMEELARFLGVAGKSTINEWEKGRSTPNKKNMTKIANIFNVDEKMLLFGSFEEYIHQKIFDLLLTTDGSRLNNIFSKYILSTDVDGKKGNKEKLDSLDTLINRSMPNLLTFLNDHGVNYLTDDKELIKSITDFFNIHLNEYMSFEERAANMLISSLDLSSAITGFQNMRKIMTVLKKYNLSVNLSFDEWIKSTGLPADKKNINDFYSYKLSKLNAEYVKSIAKLVKEEQETSKKYIK